MGFFQVRSVAEMLELSRAFPRLPGEEVALENADGRVLARDVIAAEDLPLTSRSSMDGYAVAAEDLFGAGEGQPAYLECVARLSIDSPPDFRLNPGECAGIVTGGVLPEGADAVIMVEYTQDMGAGTIEMRRSLVPGENVMLRGEDVAEGKMAMPAGRRLRPQEVGLLAALGATRIEVGRRPRVAVLSTGDELVPVESPVRPGLVRDVNTHSLAAWIERTGGLPDRRGLVRDEEAALVAALDEALDANDVVMLSGGSSVGVRDLTMTAIEALGAEVLAHGVAVSPGKPTILARLERRGEVKAIWGLPGQVASAQVVFQVLVRPLIWRLQGLAVEDAAPRPLKALLVRNVASRQGREDYVRVRLEDGPEGLAAVPMLGKSGLLRTLIDSQGLIRVPADLEGLEAGSVVDVLLFEDRG